MEFRKISIEDKPLFDAFLRLSPYVDCEYLFSTLFMWQDVLGYTCAVTEDGGCIYIRHEAEGQTVYHMPITVPEKIPARVEYLLEREGKDLTLFCVTEEQWEQLGPELRARFTKSENRNFSDYLYEGDAIRLLAGRKYHQKRNHISRFLKSYDWDFRLFRTAGEELSACMAVQDRWDLKKLEEADWQERLLVGNEINALEKCLAHFNELGLIGGILYIDGQPKGYSIGEMSVRGGISVGIVHFEKCDSSYDGIYQAINQLFAQRALPDADFINRQDDMGVEGLRKAKLSYHPSRLVEKYTVKVCNGKE